MLLEVPLSQRDIGNAVGTSHATVARWQSGLTAPLHEHQLRLATAFGIPLSAWSRSPQLPEPRTVAGDLSAALRARADAIVGAQIAATELPDNAAALDGLLEQCRNARALPDVAPTVLARLGALEVSATNAREKMRTAVEVAFASDEWHAFFEEFKARLRHHPLCMLEMIRAELEASAPARLAAWGAAHGAWRERWAERVRAAEAANAALVEALPPGARFDTVKVPTATAA